MFVVGAGASFELGLPLGETLLKEVATALNYRIENFAVTGGSREIWNAISNHCSENRGNLNEYFDASQRVKDAAYLGLSIDNVVH